jgi:hypothetical protein
MVQYLVAPSLMLYWTPSLLSARRAVVCRVRMRERRQVGVARTAGRNGHTESSATAVATIVSTACHSRSSCRAASTSPAAHLPQQPIRMMTAPQLSGVPSLCERGACTPLGVTLRVG